MLKVQYQIEIFNDSKNAWLPEHQASRLHNYYLWDTIPQAKAKIADLIKWESYMARPIPKTRIVAIYTLTIQKIIESKEIVA
jgi:hypothetical protein